MERRSGDESTDTRPATTTDTCLLPERMCRAPSPVPSRVYSSCALLLHLRNILISHWATELPFQRHCGSVRCRPCAMARAVQLGT